MQPIPLGVYIALSIQFPAFPLCLAAIRNGEPHPLAAACVLLLVGGAILFFDFRDRAAAKGWSKWWGLLALLNLVGLMWILLLPVRQRPPARGFDVLPPTDSP